MNRQEAQAAAALAWEAFTTARDQQHDTAGARYTEFLAARDAAVLAERAEKAAKRNTRRDTRIKWGTR